MNFNEWLEENLSDYTEDIATHGCMGGFPHLTYYSDTVALYEQFEDEIWQALEDDADAFGYDTPLALVGSFNGAKHVRGSDQFKNLLVWYMAERTARELCPDL